MKRRKVHKIGNLGGDQDFITAGSMKSKVWRQWISKYLKMIRVTAWPPSLFPFAVGFGAGAVLSTDAMDAVFGFLAVFSFFSFAYALNLYADRDVDRLHDGWQKDVDLSKQPVLTGEISFREVVILCLLTAILSIFFGLLVNWVIALLMFGSCIVGGILYSHAAVRLKSKPVADIVCMSVLSIMLFTSGYFVSRGEIPTWQMLLFFGIITAIVYIPTVVSDYKFDLIAGIRTSAVVFGQRNLLRVMSFFALCTIPVAWLIWKGPYPDSTKIFVILAAIDAIIGTIIVWFSLRPPDLVMPWVSEHPLRAWAISGVVPLAFVGWGIARMNGYG